MTNEEILKSVEGKSTLPFIVSPESTIAVSEHFYSVQGEGPYTGVPAVFLRLQGCNLLCMFPCDTIPVWRVGKSHSIEKLAQEFNKLYGTYFKNGAHLILTGGEPMMRQKELIEFLICLESVLKSGKPYVEVETNGTIMPQGDFEVFIDHYNISPKLANSKMSVERRVRPEVIRYLIDESPKRTIFKFVVDKQEDIAELVDTYAKPFGIPSSIIYLMPECTSDVELREKQAKVIEWCKESGYRYSNRLHIEVYNELTGV